MTEAAYVAAIHEENGVYGVSFPDFPGCVTTASDMTSAIERGTQALALHVEGMIEDAEGLPEPRAVERLRADEPEWMDGAVLALIPVEVPGKALRINISLDETLLARIDKAAARSGQTRSGFLASAARERIKAAGATRAEDEIAEDLSDVNWLNRLDVVNCARQGDEVVRSGAYACPMEGSAFQHKRSRFFGLYRKKKVEMVSEIEAVIDIIDIKSKQYKLKWKNVEYSDQEIVDKADEIVKHKIELNTLGPRQRRLFLLGRLFPTDFNKDTERGLYGAKTYFDVSEYEATDARALADRLTNVNWSQVPRRRAADSN